MEIILCLHNIRSTYNVGSILRTAEGLGVEKVVLSGYTPSGMNPSLMPHLADKVERQIEKTALGAEKLVKMNWCDNIEQFLEQQKKNGWQILGLENRIDDGRKFELGSPYLLSRLQNKVVLVLGEEVHGIDQSLYNHMDYFVEIPMKGQKESFNVSVAAGIALYALQTAL